jgi:hypothetical protein
MVVCPLSRGWLGRTAGVGGILMKQLMKQLIKDKGAKQWDKGIFKGGGKLRIYNTILDPP